MESSARASEAPVEVGVVIASTRPGRIGPDIAAWVVQQGSGRDDVVLTSIDLAALDLPLLDEPVPAALADRSYTQRHTARWSQIVDGLDAFVFVVPEYNRSFPASLKNALDFLYPEWHDKAAAFVSYGVDVGGSRAVDQLRIVMGELQIADVRTQVALSLFEDVHDGSFEPRPFHATRLDRLFDDLASWARAMRSLRDVGAAATARVPA